MSSKPYKDAIFFSYKQYWNGVESSTDRLLMVEIAEI